MKKILFAILFIATLFITGCGKLDETELKNKFIKEVENLKSYYMEGEMILTNNDDTYNYLVKVSYQKDNNYKVVLTNKGNNYEQIILRNSEAVYVVTPSLNKSFKFQSNWPNNNSQIYLLNSLATDLKNTENSSFELKDNNYIFTSNINYPNNPNLVKQQITLDKNNNLKEVSVLDENNITHINFKVNSLDKKPSFNDNYFDIETITNEYSLNETKENQTNPNNDNKNTTTKDKTDEKNTKENTDINKSNNEENANKEETQETMTIDETLFPLYLPENTSLANREVIDIENGQRVIMTFSGESPFILVQETVKECDELTIIPTYGEPFMLIDTVGSLTDVSYTWTSGGIEYYIVSDVMNQNELLEVAKSINITSSFAIKTEK